MAQFVEMVGSAASMIGSAASSLLNFGEKKQTLKRKLDQLQSIKADVQIELENVESSSKKRRKNEVQNWLANVEQITDKVGSIEQQVGLSKWSTALGSRVEKLIEEVEELTQKGRFEGGLVLDAPSVGGDLLLTVNMVGQEFQKNMDQILKCLANDAKLRIGVWGMGGVGKTTLLTHIHNRVKENLNTFGNVCWVTVSQDFSIHKLQQRIAKAISCCDISDEDDERTRAATLAEAFRKRGKFILILDDLWNSFKMEEVGISTTEHAYKLILTSRSLEVCRKMGCQVKIKVVPLSEEEAHKLFMEKLDRKIPFPQEIEEIAGTVIRECAGLPLGIIVMASCMREVDDACEWRDALTKLKESEIPQDDVENQVFRVLRFSFGRLKDGALEQCFLYCALYPEDEMIIRGELIEYLIIEGIIGGMESRQKQFDRGHAMLNKLENVCLLEGGNILERMKYVKMHDLIRDMAIQIMKFGPHASMVKSGEQLREIPNEGMSWTDDLQRVSLMKNNISKSPPNSYSPRCPNLVTLLLSENENLRKISNSFFKYMEGLKVLNLSSTSIKRLPKSVASLVNLSALLLRKCRSLKQVPSLANLKELKKLDVSYTGLEEVPEDMEFLCNLTYLNFRCSKIMVVRRGILVKLSNLQYLGFNWTTEMIIEEVACLQKLEYLLCWFPSIQDYNSYVLPLLKNTKTQHLGKYSHFVGKPSKLQEIFVDELDRVQNVYISTTKISKEIHLPCNIQNLDVWSRVINDGRSLCLKNAIGLKCLSVMHCENMECLFDMSSSPSIFKTLETIELVDLGLRGLFSGEGEDAPPPTTMPLPPNDAFSNLKSFHMSSCHRMKKPFHPALIRNLQNLEKLIIHDCSSLEEIIATRAQEDGSGCSNTNNHSVFAQTHDFILPKLRVLRLRFLPSLKSICSGTLICSSLQEIEVVKCEKLETIPVFLPLPSLLKLQVYPEEWWKSVEWGHPTDKSVLQPLFSFALY